MYICKYIYIHFIVREFGGSGSSEFKCCWLKWCCVCGGGWVSEKLMNHSGEKLKDVCREDSLSFCSFIINNWVVHLVCLLFFSFSLWSHTFPWKKVKLCHLPKVSVFSFFFIFYPSLPPLSLSLTQTHT